MFEFDSWILNEIGHQAIRQFASSLERDRIKRVRIEGHTDTIGSHRYNLKLSVKRAQAVGEAFIRSGIPQDILECSGLGSSQPLDKGTSGNNRRVEVIVEKI